ncbi:nicotinate phosphoribosyltransferase [uncultured Clostridium sp.]|uniref:nicotinate phosphoribosyltransferase n=1 Tax=uncultured Clostridium sp. TaxID=59620 RepID=UPI0026206EDA|nr:nicotinate phosphoribosyltransferase [uncultured Clostridium sp.]
MNKIDLKNKRNLSMLVDFYEFTMANGYFNNGYKDKIVTCDMFFRKIPDGGGFAIAAGLEQLIEYIEGLEFIEDDINYLRSMNIFSEEFLEYLLNFKFKGDIHAIEEGTPVFPNEPLVTVKARIIDAQLIETMLLLSINHQTLLATKANRIVRAANGKQVFDLGARRGQGSDAAILGARAAIIGGIDKTATTITGQNFGVGVVGTMAHSWIQFFESEYEAFELYAKTYPDNCVLLVDTYNVLGSGIPNAIKVAKEVLEPMGKRLKGIRLDSGDLAYLSKKVRKILDREGLSDCQIVASNSLDEYIIRDLIRQGAAIDIYGVGERLITAKSEPVFGGVYKLMAVEENGEMKPRIKLSENVEKVTNPGCKEVWRLMDNETNKAIADVLTIEGEVIENSKSYRIFDPVHTWKKKIVRNFTPVKLQVPIYKQGELVYKLPTIDEIQKRREEGVESLWDEIKRFENPHQYYVDLSQKLWDLKAELINKFS